MANGNPEQQSLQKFLTKKEQLKKKIIDIKTITKM